MEIRILGAHNRESKTHSCISLVIDDRLAVEAGSLTSRLTVEEQANLDSVVVTHNHMDHIRDVSMLALNFFRHDACFDIFATNTVCSNIKKYIFNKEIYPEFQNIPQGKPTVNFMDVEPLVLHWIDGHAILPVPVNHAENAVGYQVTDRNEKSIFFTGDTGPGLTECWKHVTPQLLIADVTACSKYEKFARTTGHLTPVLLERELTVFRELKGYIPDVLAIHMDIEQEPDIRAELKEVARRLQINIDVAHEEMRLTI